MVQVLQVSKDHGRARTLLDKARELRTQCGLASRAVGESRLEDAETILTQAMNIDPRNKGAAANLLAERAEVTDRTTELDM